MTSKESVQRIYHQIFAITDQLTNEMYANKQPILNSSSIGGHVRHIFDFYSSIVYDCQECFLDYDKRKRNPEIELNIEVARDHFNKLIDCLDHVDETTIIEVVTDFSEIQGSERPKVTSSIGRELMYAYDHAVHHLAIIKMGIHSTYPDIKIDSKIGVAPSTLKYQASKLN